jgi:ribosomal protein S18 acetylase RimI-like enzyme
MREKAVLAVIGAFFLMPPYLNGQTSGEIVVVSDHVFDRAVAEVFAEQIGAELIVLNGGELNESIDFREAAVDDLEGVSELLKELLEVMTDTESLDLEKILGSCRTLLADEDDHLLVAEGQGRVIGFISFCTRRTCLHPGPSALIDELAVSTNYRKQGVGKKLLLAAIEKCKQLGCCEVEVSTESTNTMARKFYGKCGFKEVGVSLERSL